MRWLLLIAVALQAASCGQSGPLRLPEDTFALLTVAQALTVVAKPIMVPPL